jgi:hypothetical protein
MSQTFDADRILSKLRPFQRASVDYVMRRYGEGAKRFLVADEVGLGKTRVAQGVLACLLRDRAQDERMDIVYVCSNAAIARQNLRQLNILGEANVHPTRLTLLYDKSNSLSATGVNFISFTPGTSFDTTGGYGVALERALIQNLIAPHFAEALAQDPYLLHDLFQRPVRSCKKWKRKLDEAGVPAVDGSEMLDEELRQRILTWRTPADKSDPERERRGLILCLRHRMAERALETLDPKLVIFDEFQRFRDLFKYRDTEPSEGVSRKTDIIETDSAKLMRRFLTKAEAKGKVLFLSATPYRFRSQEDSLETDAQFHEEFLETFKTIYGDGGKQVAEQLSEELKDFRRHFLNLAQVGLDEASRVRDKVQTRLLSVMSRNERIRADKEDGGIKRRPVTVPVTAGDLRQARAVYDVARQAGEKEKAEYWKSAPYLFSFMGDYALVRKIRGQTADRASWEAIGASAMVPAEALARFEPIDFGNGRLRELVREVLDSQAALHRRLWLPPSLGYVARPQGAAATLTKTLIFSDWQMVPEAIAGLVSYEAERLLRPDKGIPSTELRVSKSQLLRLVLDERARAASMRTLLLLYPSSFLATVVDPLSLWRAQGGLSVEKMVEAAETVIGQRLAGLEIPIFGPEPELWHLVAALDRHFGQDYDARVRSIGDGLAHKGGDAGEADPDVADEGGAPPKEGHAARALLAEATQGEGMTPRRVTEDEIKDLARLALGSPAICLLRSFRRYLATSGADGGPSDVDLARMSAIAASGFRRLFNHQEVRLLFAPETGTSSQQVLKNILEYTAEHDLQAVLDEYLFQLIGQSPLVSSEKPGEQLRQQIEFAEAVRSVIAVQPARITLHNPFTDKTDSLPSHFAARFAAKSQQANVDGEAGGRIDALRDAFNSPFRPFVLASTSVGQEGLDFHRYCHRLWHWNLPSTPVDLEQREGRVQRYLNHAVRLNIAATHSEEVRLAPETDQGTAVWPALISAAERATDASGASANGLRPHWIYEGSAAQPAHIEAVIPLPPLSREEQRAEILSRQAALYRLAFGQPRQTDLIALLAKTDLKSEEREKLFIELTPPKGGRDEATN